IPGGPLHATTTTLRPGPGQPFGAPVAQEPAWLGATGKTRVFLDAAEQTWVVNMVVPITNIESGDINAGIPLSSTFKFWFEVQVTTPGNVVPYRFIETLGLTDVLSDPDPSKWADMSRIHDPSDTTNCARQISITSNDVGTNNVDAQGVPRPNRMALN